jgi:hypothetical protein
MEDLELETLKDEELYEVEGGDALSGLLWGCLLLLVL